MKKIVTLLFFSTFSLLGLKSQNLIFEDDFETAGFPDGYILYDEDGNTVNSQVASFFPSAWNRIRFQGDPNNFIASTSWFTPIGTADDWVVLPKLKITESSLLEFKARAGAGRGNNGYQVLVSTTDNEISSFTDILLTVNSEADNWNSRIVNLSTYSGEEVYIAFRNNTYDGYIIALDDIRVIDLSNYDASVSEILIADKLPQSQEVPLKVVLRNYGLELNSVEFNWSVNGGPTNTETLSGLSLNYGDTMHLTHSIPYLPSKAGEFDNIKVWVSKPEGKSDANVLNDTLNKNVFVSFGNGVQRNVLFEEFTTAACQFCPDGHVVMEQILAQNSNVIPVSVHSCFGSDAMTNTDATNICNTLGNNSAPTGMVDRIQYPGESSPAHSRNLWVSRVNSRSLVPSTASIAMTGSYNNTSRNVNLDVDVAFIDYELSGDIRVSLMVIEDSVSGTGQGWDQINYYNNQPGHPMQGRGNPIRGYQHRHVLRQVLPTTWGDASVIPNSPSVDGKFNKNFNFSLSNNYNHQRVSFVAIVSYKGLTSDGYEVINAREIKLDNEMVSEGVDLGLMSLDIPRAFKNGDSLEVIAKLKNVGSDSIKSFDLNWTVDNGTVYTQSVSGLALGFGDTLLFNHEDKLELTGVNSSKELEVWISNINNNGDDDYVLNNSKNQTISVKELIDGELSQLFIESFVGEGESVEISGLIRNNGVEIINKLDLVWSVNGEAENVETLSNLNLEYGQTQEITHSTSWLSAALNSSHNIKVWIANVNDSTEVNTSNDTLTKSVNVIIPVDLKLEQLFVSDTLIKNEEIFISGEVTNLGAELINSFEVVWSIDGGNENRNTISNISIPYNANYRFTHSVTYTPSASLSGGEVTVYIDKVNGVDSQVNDNDTITKQFVAIVGLTESLNLVGELNIYPNPTDGLINMKINVLESANFECKVFDLTGKEVYNTNFGNLSKGNHIHRIDLRRLSEGLYFVNLRIGEEMLTKKLIITK